MKLSSIIAVVSVAVFSMAVGATGQRWHDWAIVSAQRAQPVAIIGVAACHKWYGAAIVTGDGVVHPERDLSAEEAGKIGDKLGEGHAIIAAAPCEDPST